MRFPNEVKHDICVYSQRIFIGNISNIYSILSKPYYFAICTILSSKLQINTNVIVNNIKLVQKIICKKYNIQCIQIALSTNNIEFLKWSIENINDKLSEYPHIIIAHANTNTIKYIYEHKLLSNAILYALLLLSPLLDKPDNDVINYLSPKQYEMAQILFNQNEN